MRPQTDLHSQRLSIVGLSARFDGGEFHSFFSNFSPPLLCYWSTSSREIFSPLSATAVVCHGISLNLTQLKRCLLFSSFRLHSEKKEKTWPDTTTLSMDLCSLSFKERNRQSKGSVTSHLKTIREKMFTWRGKWSLYRRRLQFRQCEKETENSPLNSSNENFYVSVVSLGEPLRVRLKKRMKETGQITAKCDRPCWESNRIADLCK